MHLVKHTFLPVLMLLLSLCGCQEIYVPDELNSDSKILVINGAVTNNGGPHKVTIAWATPFLSSSTEPVNDATVNIVDNNGQTYPLRQTAKGIYETYSDHLMGTPGKSYTLKVTLPDGTPYHSESITMVPPIDLNTLSAEPGERGSLNENSDGTYVEEIEKGLHIYADINLNTEEKHYFRFEPHLASQSYILIDTVDASHIPRTIVVRCIDVSYMNKLPNVKTTIKSGAEQIIKKHSLGFVPYFRRTKYYDRPVIMDGDTVYQAAPFLAIPYGWIITANVYHVSRSEYQYYNKVTEQLEATNQIFDPLPSSIRGNITCTADTTQQVLGYFSVAAKTIYSKGMNWMPGKSTIEMVDVTDYPYAPVISIQNDTIVPEGWVIF